MPEAVFVGAELTLRLGVKDGNNVVLIEPQKINLRVISQEAFTEVTQRCHEMLRQLQQRLTPPPPKATPGPAQAGLSATGDLPRTPGWPDYTNDPGDSDRINAAVESMP